MSDLLSKFYRLVLGAVVLPLLVGSTISLTASSSSAQGLKSTCANLVMKPVRGTRNFIRSQYQQFRSELKEQGKMRLIIKDRHNPEKFDWWASLVDPIMDLPLESYSLVKHKVFGLEPVRKAPSLLVSLPVGFFVWYKVMDYIDEKNHQLSLEALQRGVAQDRLGALALSEWVVDGVLLPTDAIHELKELEAAFAEFAQTGKSEYLRLRFEDLVTAKLFRPVEIPLLRQLLKEALLEQRDLTNIKEAELRGSFLNRVLSASSFSEISSMQKFALSALLWPRQVVEGKSDLFWYAQLERHDIAMKSLRDLVLRHGPSLSYSFVINMIASSLNQPSEVISARLSRVEKSPFASELRQFAYRVDIPGVSGELKFDDFGRNLEMQDELDRWLLLTQDSRFRDLLDAWLAGELSQVEVMAELTYQVVALSQISEVYRTEGMKISDQSLELFVFGGLRQTSEGREEVAAHAMFASVAEMASFVKDPTQRRSLILKLGRIYYRYYVKANLIQDVDQRRFLFEKAREEERAVLLEFERNVETSPKSGE